MTEPTSSWPLPEATSDVWDAHPEHTRVCAAPLRHFGARTAFAGRVTTLASREDNLLLKSVLTEDGRGRVLVVDGGGTTHCAMMGGNKAAVALASGWEGVVINGAVRDVTEIAALDVGVVALGSNPRRSRKTGEGRRDVAVSFGDIVFAPGDLLVCDADGVVVIDPADLPS